MPEPTNEPSSEYAALKAELDALKAKVAAAPPPEPTPAPKEGEFDFNTFAQAFAGGKPDEAMDQLDQKRFGFKVREVLPVLAATVMDLKQRDQLREARDWMNGTPDYDPTPENSEKLLKKVEELGLADNAHGYRLAWNELRADDKSGVKVRSTDDGRPPVTPRRSAPARDAAPKYDEEKLRNLSDEDLDKLVGAAG